MHVYIKGLEGWGWGGNGLTLLQAKWSAVFLCASCSVRSTLALFTSTSATHHKHGRLEKKLQLTRKTCWERNAIYPAASIRTSVRR